MASEFERVDYSKRVRVAMEVRKIKDNIHKMENDVLQLMRHPDATPEQLTQAGEMLRHIDIHKAHVNLKLAKYGIKV